MRREANAGFTLVEIVIAISILSMVLGTAYSTLTQIISVKRMLDDRRDLSVTAYSVIRRLSRELQLASADKGHQLIFQNNQNSNAAAMNGLYLLGEHDGASNDSADSITFIAQEGGQYLPDGGTHTGLVQITYKVMKDPENQSRNLSLIREEIPYVVLPNTNNSKVWQNAKNKAFQQQVIFPVTENVVSFKLSYYDRDDEKWLSEWGSNKRGAIPAMVNFTIALSSPQGKIESYSTSVPVGAWSKTGL